MFPSVRIRLAALRQVSLSIEQGTAKFHSGSTRESQLKSVICRQMQHEQVALEEGTPLLRSKGLVLISNTAKGFSRIVSSRICYHL